MPLFCVTQVFFTWLRGKHQLKQLIDRNISWVGQWNYSSGRTLSPATIINPHVFGSNACWDQTLSMINIGVSPIPYAELPVEARALLFIFALGAAAHYMGQPPN